MCNDERKGTYSVFFFIKHEGSDGPTGIGVGTGLALDTDSGTAPAVLVLGPGNGASGHRHDREVVVE